MTHVDRLFADLDAAARVLDAARQRYDRGEGLVRRLNLAEAERDFWAAKCALAEHQKRLEILRAGEVLRRVNGGGAA